MKPLFIFSLPRSGSTLLQRLLATHSEISTTAEPWLLLPQLYALKDQGVYTEYFHKDSSKAINDFCQQLPNGKDDYFDGMRHFISRLYQKASNGNTKYFLDKTPRYHLISEEIINLFPDGKFIFLWRNPLAVCASIQDTWASGKWNLYTFKIDLFDGLENLISTYDKYNDRVLSLRFEDLIANPDQHLARIFDYLELPQQAGISTNFKDTKLSRRMGDPTGINRYLSVDKEPINKWQTTTRNPVRKTWAKHYLKWIGAQRLHLMGYDIELLLTELKATPQSLFFMGSDILRIGFGLSCYILEPRIIKMKAKSLLQRKKIHYHM